MKKNIIRSIFSYGIIQYVILAAGFIKGIYQAKYLGPALLGTYGLVALFIEYMRFANLGTTAGMNLDASVHHGKADKQEYVRLLVNNVFTYLTLLSAVFIGAAVIIHFFFPSLLAADIRKYVFAIAFFGLAGQFKLFAINYVRLQEKYYWMNRFELTSSVILFVGVILFVARFKLDAVIGAMLASSLATFGLALWVTLPHVTLNMNWKILKGLVVLGLPILLYNLSEKIFTSIDRLIIVNYLPRESMGYFTLANTVLSSTMVLLTAFTVISYPKVLKKFNLGNRQEEGTQAILDDLKKYTSLLSAVSIGLGLIGIVLMEPFVRILLPNYGPSILLYQILALGMMFDNLTYFAGSYLVSNKHQFLLMGLLGVVSLFTLSANFLAVKMGWGLHGIAVATCFSMIFYGLGKVFMVLKKMGHFQVGHLVGLFKRYFFLVLALVPLFIWLPAHLYLIIPFFLTLYFPEIKEILNRFRASLA